MAEQTVTIIYEAQVARAQRNMQTLARSMDTAADSAEGLERDLKSLDNLDVSPNIDADISKAEKNVKTLTSALKRLEAQPNSAKIDADIAKAEKKVNQFERELEMLSRQAPSPQITARTEKAQANLERVKGDIKALTGMRAEVVAVADVEKARNDLSRAEAQLKLLQGAKAEMMLTADTQKAQGDIAGVKSELKNLDGTTAEVQITADTDSLRGISAKAEAEGSKAGTGMGKMLMDGFNSTPILGAVAGVLGAAGAAGVAAFVKSLNFEKALDTMAAAGNISEAESRKYGQAAAAAYKNAWGNSLNDLVSTAQVARENMLIFDDMTQADIQTGIEQLTAVSELLGVDVSEAAEAAGNMIKNGMVDNATEAFDVLTSGLQNGANRSGDLVDTFREYPALFQSLGLTGQEAMGLIGQSMEAGAFNADKAADAIKEFSIRAQDGSETSAAGFDALGLSAEDMSAKIAAGGDTARDGLQQVLDGLRSIEDPMARNAAGVALFGTQWEDLGNGAQILAMNLDDLGGKWVVAGDTAEQAMARMTDNASSRMQEVWRTLEGSATEVAGMIAEAIGPSVSQLSDYIANNKSEVMQFFVDVGNGAFELAKGFVNFAADAMIALGSVSTSLATIAEVAGTAVMAMGYLTGNMELATMGAELGYAAQNMRTFGENAESSANTMRDSMLGSIDQMQGKFNEFSGGAVLQAKISDATTAMIGQLDGFKTWVAEQDVPLNINGRTVDAETALNSLVDVVNASDGTVNINGQTYDASNALEGLKTAINSSGGTVTISGNPAPAQAATDAAVMGANAATGIMTIDGNNSPANAQTDIAVNHANGSTGIVTIDGNNQPANSATDGAVGHANRSTGSINVDAATATAESKINNAARDRSSTLSLNIKAFVSGVSAKVRSALGLAHGGYVMPGLATGGTVGSGYGWVPANRTLPGKDNVLWPLARGGQTLSQPLAGGEFVMNPVASASWGPVLEWMNKGGKPSQSPPASQPAHQSPVSVTVENRIDERGFHSYIKGLERTYGRG